MSKIKEDIEARTDIPDDIKDLVESLLKKNEQLIKGNNLLREVVENSIDASYKRNLQNDRYEYLSPAFEKISGYTIEEFKNLGIEKVLEIVHKDDIYRVNKEIINSSSNTNCNFIEYRFKHKDGTYRWFSDKFITLFDKAGQPVFHVGNLSDITEHRKTQDELSRSENKLQKLFNAMTDVILVLDNEGRYIEIATTNANLLYLPRQDLIGKKMHEVLPCEFADFCLENIKKTLSGGSFGPIDYKLEIGGKEIWFSGSGSKLSGTEILWVSRDVTQRKAMEIELREAKEKAEAANLAKSQFLANMSHELRTPLNGIMGFAQILIQDNIGATREAFEIIYKSGENLVELINDILEFSRIEAGKLKINNLPFNLYKLIYGISVLLRPKIKISGLEFTLNYPENVPQNYVGDERIIRQILTNLIANATKFTHEGGITVNVSGEKDDEMFNCVIDVIDTGIGIPSKKIGRLGEKFYQADAGITRKYGGTGMGLSISKSLANLLKGDIQIQSEIGRGSIFTLNLKLEVEKETQTDSIAKEKTKMSFPVNVLVVEDDSTNRMVLTRLLNHIGITQTHSVSNGEQALEKLGEKNHGYDLVLMDCQMPIMDGYESTTKIRIKEKETGIHTPIIAITAHAGEEQKKKCLSAGMDDYLCKPIKIHELAEKMEKWLKK